MPLHDLNIRVTPDVKELMLQRFMQYKASHNTKAILAGQRKWREMKEMIRSEFVGLSTDKQERRMASNRTSIRPSRNSQTGELTPRSWNY